MKYFRSAMLDAFDDGSSGPCRPTRLATARRHGGYASGLLALAVVVACFDPSEKGEDASEDATGDTTMMASTSTGALTTESTGPADSTSGSSTMASLTSLDPEPSSSSEGGGDDSDSTDASTGESSGNTETGPISCDDEATPFLVDGQCRACDRTPNPDGACAELFPEQPLCIEGQCRECGPGLPGACAGDTPACGPDFRCRPCSYHSECPESACHIAEGRCFSPDLVVHVDPEASRCPGTGTEQLPFCEFISAYATIPEGGEGVIVLDRPGIAAIDSEWRVDGNRSVAVIAPRRSRRSSGPDFGTGNHIAIQAVGAALYLDGIVVEGPHGAGVYGSEGAFVVLDNSFVYAGQAVASLATASFLVRNSFLQASDFGVNGRGASADGDGELRILYSTILGVTRGALLCDGESEVQVRNSVLLTEREDAADTIDCPDADVSYSVLSTPYSGFGNVEVGHYTLNEWHHAPDTGFEIGLRLTPQGAELVRDIAMWRDRDPVVDIDGQSRPARPGAADYAGCEIP